MFVLAVFSSAALLVVPPSMARHARFVAEMVILLCLIAPLSGIVATGTDLSRTVSVQGISSGSFSLSRFYAQELESRIRQIGQRAGIPIESVKVAAAGGGLTLTGVTVSVSEKLDSALEAAFRDALAAYVGLRRDSVVIVQPAH